ncbi:S1 family peptidase [Amycolatopsis palatopharyngis]|uniref:S1 family peptidase n=1 Tax=Amycolatopsis palatopharyngis TaxID=187982 RepID=UPI000E2223C5|nr:serine protease [Amycolatopsis palatopharyngis]
MRYGRGGAATVLALTLTLLAAGVQQASAAQPLIVGGTDADEPYPFMVSLQDRSEQHFCGGSLLSPSWILTAAHCVEGRQPRAVNARIGSADRTQGGELRAAAEIVVHPAYDPNGAGGDLAMVRLTEPAKAAPVPVAATTEVGMPARILGWGQTCPTEGCGDSPVQLQQLDTSLVEGKLCTAPFDDAAELCVDNPGGDAGSCYGDSGGPALRKVEEGRWEVLAVTSRPGNGDRTCATGPSIYTSATAYSSWITEQMAPPPEPEPKPGNPPAR